MVKTNPHDELPARLIKMHAVTTSTSERCVIAAAAALAIFAILMLAACSNAVTSRANVRPTAQTGDRALRLLRGDNPDPGLRFVYGYFPRLHTECADVRETPSEPADRYGVLVCERDRALSVAYFIDSWDGTGRTPDDDTDRRLALIATDELVPVEEISKP
ncbi:hypothetical protein KPL74_06320 [Bacillus sp. NP157]|nr:hypothetical protein KPL74_06320 [Bacillus sp. NP157]